MLEKMFKLKENNTTVKTEVLAGITTFMTMAYILAVNPSMLAAAGMDKTAVLMATCIASFIGTLAMAMLANYPFALAPGMGLNAYFAYTVCGAMGYDWKIAPSEIMRSSRFTSPSSPASVAVFWILVRKSATLLGSSL